jgi:hypothetical protein
MPGFFNPGTNTKSCTGAQKGYEKPRLDRVIKIFTILRSLFLTKE